MSEEEKRKKSLCDAARQEITRAFEEESEGYALWIHYNNYTNGPKGVLNKKKTKQKYTFLFLGEALRLEYNPKKKRDMFNMPVRGLVGTRDCPILKVINGGTLNSVLYHIFFNLFFFK